jgi:hypothetical protein
MSTATQRVPEGRRNQHAGAGPDPHDEMEMFGKDPAQNARIRERYGEPLLRALFAIMEPRGQTVVPTREILFGLLGRQDGPWRRWWAQDIHAGHLDWPGYWVAYLLKPFGVRSVTYGLRGSLYRAYAMDDVRRAVERLDGTPLGTTEAGDNPGTDTR